MLFGTCNIYIYEENYRLLGFRPIKLFIYSNSCMCWLILNIAYLRASFSQFLFVLLFLRTVVIVEMLVTSQYSSSSPWIHKQPQYHPYSSPVHSPHRHSPAHSPIPNRRHSPHRQSSQNNTLTVPCTLPVQLQNFIANHNPGPPSPNHLLSSMDSLSVNSDAILGTSPHSPMSSGASIGHNGPVSPSMCNSHQLQQPKIVISSELSSNSSMLDMNGGHCSDQSSRMCSNSQKDPAEEPKVCWKIFLIMEGMFL